MEKKKTRGIMGRPASIDKIMHIKRLFDQGLSFSQVKKETGIDTKSLFRWKHYPLERLQEQVREAINTGS